VHKMCHGNACSHGEGSSQYARSDTGRTNVEM
jgi:hypothetical protein